MSWYNRIASARTKKMNQIIKLIEELESSMEGSDIDKLSCEKAVDKLLKKIEKSSNKFIISDDLLSYVQESLVQAKLVLRDSPTKFNEIIEDAMITLDQKLYNLQTG